MSSTAKRCFDALVNACLENDKEERKRCGSDIKDGDLSVFHEDVTKSLCDLASAQPFQVTLAVRTGLSVGDIVHSSSKKKNSSDALANEGSSVKINRVSLGWRNVRRLLLIASHAARSIESLARQKSKGVGGIGIQETASTSGLCTTSSSLNGNDHTKITDDEIQETVDMLIAISIDSMLDGDPENISDAAHILSLLAPTFSSYAMCCAAPVVSRRLALSGEGKPPEEDSLAAVAALAEADPEAFTEYCAEALSLLLPTLGAIRLDSTKQAACDAIKAIASSLAGKL